MDPKASPSLEKPKVGEVVVRELGHRVTREALTQLLESEPLNSKELEAICALTGVPNGARFASELARRVMESSDFAILSGGSNRIVRFVSWNGEYQRPSIKVGDETLLYLKNVSAEGTGGRLGSFVTLFNFDRGGRNAILIFSDRR